MSLIARALAVLAFAAVPAAGQTPASHPYDLDPYKPSDAALLRNYGETLVAQTPLLELRELDPYKPSHAALLRQIGGGWPLWMAWYPLAGLAPWIPRSSDDGRRWVEPAVAPAARHPMDESARDLCACADAGPPQAGAMATVRRPESNDGVWIEFQQQRWTSAGKSVPLVHAEFARVGQYGEFPVYRRTGAGDDLIYLPTAAGWLAPYRSKAAGPR